ncbi:MAG: hypothetical protein V7641_4890 [Blastocatellia bacterium]
MKRYKELIKRSRFFIPVVILVCITLLSVTAWSSGSFSISKSRPQQKAEELYNQRKENLQKGTIAVENRTSHLEVVSLDKHLEQNLIVLTLSNRYPRPVTGYKFSAGISIEYTECRNQPVPSGEEVREFLPLQAGLDVKGIKILAVILDDESTDGDPQFVREIKDYREGARIQRTQALRLLQEADNSRDTEAALSTIEAQLAPLTPNESKSLSADMVSGINSERHIISQELHHIRTMPSSQPRGMEKSSAWNRACVMA